MTKRIAIIGAGISGLALAQRLKDHADVTLYEKENSVGGRMSTHHVVPFFFDHGPQFFTARTRAFQAFLKPFIESGTVDEWCGKAINLEIGKKITKRLWFEPHLVANPNMNSLGMKLSEDLDIHLASEVAPLSRKRLRAWTLQNVEGSVLGEYDWVISTAPPSQTITLFDVALPRSSPLHAARMQGCYSLMIGFDKPWDRHWIAAKVRNNPIKWISVNSSKPGRDKTMTAIVAHSRGNWAHEHIEHEIAEVQRSLIMHFEAVAGIDCRSADYISTHRWKHAIVEETEKAGFYHDTDQRIAATSDWASTSRIEEVWINAMQLADEITKTL